MRCFIVLSNEGKRYWWADDPDHAREQHLELFPDDGITTVYELESRLTSR